MLTALEDLCGCLKFTGAQTLSRRVNGGGITKRTGGISSVNYPSVPPKAVRRGPWGQRSYRTKFTVFLTCLDRDCMHGQEMRLFSRFLNDVDSSESCFTSIDLQSALKHRGSTQRQERSICTLPKQSFPGNDQRYVFSPLIK